MQSLVLREHSRKGLQMIRSPRFPFHIISEFNRWNSSTRTQPPSAPLLPAKRAPWHTNLGYIFKDK